MLSGVEAIEKIKKAFHYYRYPEQPTAGSLFHIYTTNRKLLTELKTKNAPSEHSVCRK
jgi:hypothetical protein